MPDTDPIIRLDNPGSSPPPETGWFRFAIRGMQATIVSDGRMLPHSIAAFFPAIPAAEMDAVKPRAGVDGTHFSMEQTCLILRYPGHVVLFDTGVGTDPAYSREHSGILLRSMAAAGIDPAEVTEVVLTHAQSDHARGLVDANGAPNFPKARLIVPRREFEVWTDPARVSQGGFIADFILGARRNLLPYQDRMTLIFGDEGILPGIRALSSPGHSPGHCSCIIGFGADRCIFLGDMAHTGHLQMIRPDWSCAHDSDPVQAAQTRRTVLERAASEGWAPATSPPPKATSRRAERPKTR